MTTETEVKQMMEEHNDFVERQIEKAKKGETISLTDLMISKERVQDKKDELEQKKEFYKQKQANKLEHTLNQIEKKETEIENRVKFDRDMSDLLMGQPILIGHHSEKKHRRLIEKLHNNTHKEIELRDEVKSLEKRAVNLVNPKSISSDDPDAIIRLEEKIADLKKQKAYWKTIKKANPRTYDSSEADQAWYVPQSLSAEIRRCKKRIEELKQVAETPDYDKTINGVRIYTDKLDNRLKVVFPSKPTQEIISKLKINGFRWSTFNKVWQRMISPQAEYWAESIAKEIKA